MKRISVIIGLVSFCLCTTSTYAGNPKRTGQAGAMELLINPWARSSGWYGLNVASVNGIEAMNSNVGGLAFTKKTEAVFARTSYLQGSGISVNAFGLSQKIGSSSVVGVSITALDFGDIEITTEDQPEGGQGTISPQFINFAVGYAHSFSNSIHGGLVVRSVSEAVANVKATGIAIDAGIQYVTGKRNETKFGVALRNVGPQMKYEGDGLSQKALNTQTGITSTVLTPTQSFELPSLLNIGTSYDIQLAPSHRFTVAGNFTSNSFTQDNIGIGGEYSFKNYFMLRAGYNHEKGIFDAATRLTAYTGGSAGATIELPLGKKGGSFALDYSFIGTYVFAGNHAFGARFTI